ncbi:hydrogenase maturation protein, partial [Acidovorax sp. HMWF018]|uniref:enoyl-CoA hydratase-related protein n=2 Tax=Comamonadaceae TaxID=80864 RepID=UPI000D3A6E45
MSAAPGGLRILLLCHSFNSLTQRLFAELRARGHTVSVELDINDRVTEEAVALFRPDLLLAPFLKRRIPASVWQALTCLVVHPGPPGDQGPSALDWAVLRGERTWGVTVLQANADFDAGPVWAHAAFAMREASKGSLYRREVTQAALQATLAAVQRFGNGERHGDAPPPAQWRPAMRQADRAIDWARHGTAEVLARLRCADGQPGVLDALWGHACHLGDGHAASAATMAAFAHAAPGEVLAVRDGALLRRTRDGGVWIGQARRVADGAPGFKQAAADAFATEALALPRLPVPLQRADDEWSELRYTEHGPDGARVGCLRFDFHNGAMSIARCERLRDALLELRERPVRVLMLLGGEDFFSNGIDLNAIEAAAHRPGDSAADASWRHIQAMNDAALAVIETPDRLTVSVLRGNAGAGGAFLALAADEVWAHGGVVLNPHYKNMGNLYGSEYWTYLLPRRLSEAGAKALMAQRLPLLAREAAAMGLIDHCDDGAREGFETRCLERA